jgi:hypothetical protein
MKRLVVTVNCMAVYNSFIDVPDGMNIDEAIKYAKKHLSNIPIINGLEYVSDSDELDEENCEFEDAE